MFLSPAGNQIARDLCLQNSSSWYSIALIFPLTSCICSKLSASFIVVSCTSILSFSASRDVKLPIFLLHATRANLHALIFEKSLNIGLPLGASLVHAPCIICSHSGYVAHYSSNLLVNFFLLPLCVSLCKVSKIGSWSKYDAWRCLTEAYGNNSLHSIIAQALSSLSWTNAAPGLPFRHVNILP